VSTLDLQAFKQQVLGQVRHDLGHLHNEPDYQVLSFTLGQHDGRLQALVELGLISEEEGCNLQTESLLAISRERDRRGE